MILHARVGRFWVMRHKPLCRRSPEHARRFALQALDIPCCLSRALNPALGQPLSALPFASDAVEDKKVRDRSGSPNVVKGRCAGTTRSCNGAGRARTRLFRRAEQSSAWERAHTVRNERQGRRMQVSLLLAHA